jgi:hypothetical protein
LDDVLKSGEESNFLNETDFVWSKYKCANINEVYKMINFEIKQLQDL